MTVKLLPTLLAVLTALAASTLFETSAEACVCTGPKLPSANAVRRADVAFRGTITAVRFDEGFKNIKRNRWYRPTPTTLVFRVEGVYRGVVFTRTEVSLGRTSCSLKNTHRKQLRVGQEWIILAKHKKDGSLYTRQCVGSAPTSRAKKDLKRLGAGRAPIAKPMRR